MKELSSHAHAAKLIRQELKKAFPHIKFRVTSDCYSMGNSVDIHWDNGVPVKEVEAYTAKYQYGSFDSMTDSYDYDNKNVDIPQVKYVMEHRTITNDIYKEMEQYLKNIFNDIKEPIDRMSYRYLSNVDLSGGLTEEKIRKAIFG